MDVKLLMALHVLLEIWRSAQTSQLLHVVVGCDHRFVKSFLVLSDAEFKLL